MKFRERLRELRIEKRLTQRELASVLGLSANCICEWEKGRSEPSIESLKRLAVCLESSIDYLLGFSDDFGNVDIMGEPLGENLTSNERELLRSFRALPTELKERAIVYVDKLEGIVRLENK